VCIQSVMICREETRGEAALNSGEGQSSTVRLTHEKAASDNGGQDALFLTPRGPSHSVIRPS
jgi:hypothetical protein